MAEIGFWRDSGILWILATAEPDPAPFWWSFTAPNQSEKRIRWSGVSRYQVNKTRAKLGSAALDWEHPQWCCWWFLSASEEVGGMSMGTVACSRTGLHITCTWFWCIWTLLLNTLIMDPEIEKSRERELFKLDIEGSVAAWPPNKFKNRKVRKILHKSYIFYF